MTTVLVVDDDPSVTVSLALLLKRKQFKSIIATNPSEALAALKSADLVLQDMNFTRATSGEEGLQLLRSIRLLEPAMPVILITAWGSIDLAVEGMKAGAADFITKPWDNERLIQTIETALNLRLIKTDHDTRHSLQRSSGFEEIIGEDSALMRLLDFVGRIAKTDATVLVTGESGTGKELLANAIHRNSTRGNGPLVKVNMGAVVSSLFESEMFGHVRGAFTGAVEDRIGYFERANGGTIMLDEVAELDKVSQVKLLRVLQDREYRRVGSSTTKSGDFRVVAATNKNLKQLVAQGAFREDLYYRLNLISFELPPLRARRGDIKLLTEAHLAEIKERYNIVAISLTPDAYAWLEAQEWPGNIRQLRHCVERVVLLRQRDSLTARDFHELASRGDFHPQGAASVKALELTRLNDLERVSIESAMMRAGQNITKAAELLGVSRQSLYRRLSKFGLVRE